MAKAKLISYYKFGESWNWINISMARAIQIWTRSKYFHTELIIGNKRISAHTKNGVFVTGNLNTNSWSINADIKEIEIDENKVQEAIEFARTQINKGYDWKGIFFSQVIPADKHDKEKWFCNEIAGEVLKIAGAKGIDKDTNEYNPGSFQEIF